MFNFHGSAIIVLGGALFAAAMPAAARHSFYGNLVGWWEGNSLVVDTVGMLTDPDIQTGVPHTGKLHILERITLTPEGFVTLRTLTVPTPFEAPRFTQKTCVKSDPEIAEYVCLRDNNRFAIESQGILRQIEPASSQ